MFEIKKVEDQNNFEVKQDVPLVAEEGWWGFSCGRARKGRGGQQRGEEEKYLLIFLTRFMCRFFELISRTMPKGDYLPVLLHICS